MKNKIKIKNKTILFLLFFGILTGLFWINQKFLTLEKIKNWEKLVLENLIDKINKEVFSPPPLREEKTNPDSYLTKNGIIYWTNIQRQNNNLKPLSENQLLKKAAENKIEDMFKNQYFDHISPQGYGPSYFVENAGYQYLIIGENLAMGDFKNDQVLVEAWMNSPGHRANILNPKFTEIGVAAKRGWIEGRYTWLAVQVFGKPASLCLKPDESLKNQIETLKEELLALEKEIEKVKKEIENTNVFSSSYKEKVEEYNSLVEQYNTKVEILKNLIEKYNSQVNRYNNCIKN